MAIEKGFGSGFFNKSILFELAIRLFIFSFYRAEGNISILSEKMKDIRESKRQDADERLQGLQKENASLKADLSKASDEYDMLTIAVYLYRYLI